MVLVVGVVPELLVVDGVVEHGCAEHELVQESSVALDGENVLVPPAPKSSAAALHNGTGMEVATSQPGSQFTNLHLAQGGVGLAIEASGVVWPVNLLVVGGGVISDSPVRRFPTHLGCLLTNLS